MSKAGARGVKRIRDSRLAFPYAELEELLGITKEEEQASNSRFDAVFPSFPEPRKKTLREYKREWRKLYWRRYKLNLIVTVVLSLVYGFLITTDAMEHDWYILTFNAVFAISVPIAQLVLIPGLTGIWRICPYLPNYKRRIMRDSNKR